MNKSPEFDWKPAIDLCVVIFLRQAPKFKKVKKAVRPVRPPSDSDQDSDSQEDGGGEEEDEEEQSPSPEPQQSPSPPSAATDTATGTITPSAVNIVTPAKSNTPPKEYQVGCSVQQLYTFYYCHACHQLLGIT